jgi:hypothetical protein
VASTRRALLIGINTYTSPVTNLRNAVADAQEVARFLGHHSDGKPNFDCRLLCDQMEDGKPVGRANLREAITELFTDSSGTALFYFSGHGVLTPEGGFLCTTDAMKNDWGVSMDELMVRANASKAKDVVIILDCCHSGDIANPAILKGAGGGNPLALVRENCTVIAASRDFQVSIEAAGHGLFTAAVIEALDGGAADHMGWVTAPSIYAYVERRFGTSSQRPVYKSHTTSVTVVRECAPLIERLKLHDITKHFPVVDFKFALDPEFEPEDETGKLHEPVNERKVEIALLFKDYRDAGLLKPSSPKEQLYWTARKSHTVELTPRGREYWTLVKKGLI